MVRQAHHPEPGRRANSNHQISDATDDVKELIDALNSFLMQKRVEGKKAVLFIDDAQNLKGYPAGILPVTDSKARTWYAVRIGDYPSRQEAVKHAEAFISREKMECAIRPFEKL
jgi:hypothetical protein